MLLWVAVIVGTGAGIYYIFRRFRKIRDGSTSRPRQPNNGTNPDEELSSEAEDAWRRKDCERLLQLLEKDSPFPVGFSIEKVVAEQSIREQLKQLVDDRKSLHKWIMEGNLEAIKEYTENHKAFHYYDTDNVSALSRAMQYEKKDISPHFLDIMPKFSILEMAEENVLYSGIMEKPHLKRLVSVTSISEENSKEEYKAIIKMYQNLEKQRKISCLFKAVQNEKFQIIFAMKTDTLEIDYTEVNGYTEPNGRIFIAGKGINTTERKQEVYRVFAHEFCHLAMQCMYKNNFKPYLPHDEKRISAFSDICKGIHKKYEAMDKIFQKVYKKYNESKRHGELIVRIPEMMVFSDEENALERFGEQTSELYNYYEEHIVKDCEEFSDSKFYSPELMKLKDISNDHLVVPNADICFPLFAKSESYKNYLVPGKARGYEVSFLPTSNPELGALQILYELEKLHADKRYLAFKYKHYQENGNNKIICGAFDKPNAFEKLILVIPDTMVNCELKKIYENIFFSSTKEKEVIVVVSSELCDKFPEWKVTKKLQFNWNVLSKGFKNKLLKNIASETFSSFSVEKDMYIPRTFVRSVYKEENFQGEKMPSHYLFMTGVSKLTNGNLKKWSQTLTKYDDQIENGKYIFVPKNEEDNPDLFKKFCSKNEKESKQVFWIHHTNGKYLLREPLERSEDILFEKQTFVEDKMLEETVGMRVVLVADDPGAGKSMSITSLIEKMKESYESITSPIEEMKESYPKKLIFRVNFSEHLKEFPSSPSLKSFLEFLQRVFKMNTPLKQMTFQGIIDDPGRVVVFFDGFDEMTKYLQDKAIKSLKLIREKTEIQMWIFTRKHERLTLQDEMNTISFSLKEFSDEDERTYLNKFWERRLELLYQEENDSEEKFQKSLKNLEKYSVQSEVLLKSMNELVNIQEGYQEEFREKLEVKFIDYTKLVIKSVKDILKGKVIVPLWLWMIANIIIDSKFEIPNQTNRFAFYSTFMDKKVNSYLMTECEISSLSKKQKRMYDIYRKIIFKNLWMFSVKVMQSDLKKDDLKDDDLQELVDVGLLRKVGEEHYFFHKTFAEFLFSQMFVEEIESVNAKLLSDILIKDSYREVRIFLDDFLEKSESQSFVFPKVILQEFKLFEIYSEFCEREYDRTGGCIWKRIFKSCEIHMKESVDENSILDVLKFSPFNESKYSLDGVLDVLNSTFTDKMLFIMFDSQVDVSHMFLFRCLFFFDSNDLKAMISIFKKIFNYKESHLRSVVPYTANSVGNVKVGLKFFEKEYKNENGNSVLHLMTEYRKGKVLEDLREIQSMIGNGQLNKLLTMQNGFGMTMLHILMIHSRDPKVVISFLEFVEGVMEGEPFKHFLIQMDNYGKFPISYANFYIMKDILVFMGRYFNNQYIIDMLKINKVYLGKSVLYTDCALEDILYLEKFLGREFFKEILISKDEEYGGTRLHWLMINKRADKLYVSDLKVYASLLDSREMRDFLFSQDKYGHTFLHDWAESYEGPWESIDIILRELHSILSPDAFENLLNIRNERGETFIHKYHSPISELYSFLVEFLGKEKSIKLVTDKDNRYGETRLHWINYLDDKFDVLFKDLKFYSELLDESSFRDLILTKDKNWKTFCYHYDLSELNELKDILSPELFLELRKTVKSELE